MVRVSVGTNQTEHTLRPPPFPHLLHQPPPAPATPPPALKHGGLLDSNISPSVLLIIVILSVVFFVSGLLHLLLRLLLRPGGRGREDLESGATAMQGQLQQLFHLHDAGVDQSFIDALPVFPYGAVVGAGGKDPFDCAVCLCEFEPDDKLRLLPRCSHAFHLDCIDTWLLSHSTCPLCRSTLLCSPLPSPPLVLVLESGRAGTSSPHGRPSGASAHLGEDDDDDLAAKEEMGVTAPEEEVAVVPVKLGKFRTVEVAGAGEDEGTSDGGLDGRRCFSMGSFEYVMDETSQLQVAIQAPARRPPGAKEPPRHRLAMSDCDCHSRREGFKGFDEPPGRESFSVSKVWLRPRKEKPAAASSFLLPLQRAREAEPAPEVEVDDGKAPCGSSRRTAASEVDFDVEAGSYDGGSSSVGSRPGETPSFARRTLLWVVGAGRQHHKVVNHV